MSKLTQIEKIAEQVKAAMLARYPIVYIPTYQKELVHELVFGGKTFGSFIPRMIKEDGDGPFRKVSESNTTFELSKHYKGETRSSNDTFNFVGSITDSHFAKAKNGYPQPPTLFVSYNEKFDEAKSLCNSLIKYSLGLKTGPNPLDSQVQEVASKSLLIVVTPKSDTIPQLVAPYVYTVTVPQLEPEEIKSIIATELRNGGIEHPFFMSKGFYDKMKNTFRGFSALRIRQTLRYMIGSQIIDFSVPKQEEEKVMKSVINAISDSKKQIMGSMPGLRWVKTESANAVGLDNVTEWLKQHAPLFTNPEQAIKNHLETPNGMLITGIPGSGKSLMAKQVARTLGDIPLLQLDMGTIRAGKVGESENNLNNALQMAESLSPCVLWIDEIEKAFGDSKSSSNGDSGVGQRLLGTFLTWMQEKKETCYIFCTANDVTKLPPELLRSGRIDVKFFTFMPTAQECAEIFVSLVKAQNKQYQREWKDFENKNCPRYLFPCQKTKESGLTSEDFEDVSFWVKFLNENCSSAPYDVCLIAIDDKGAVTGNESAATYQWHNSSKTPGNKLLSGADIAAILKEAKFQTNKNKLGDPGGMQSASANEGYTVYEETRFKHALIKVIQKFRPYGQTNLRDIALCFHSLFKNKFEPASQSAIFEFDRFDEDKLVYTPAVYFTKDNSDKIEKMNRDNRKRTYDEVLVDTITGAINRYLPEAKKEGGLR